MNCLKHPWVFTTRLRRWSLAASLLLVALYAQSGQQLTVVAGQTNANPHYVFAHYMVCCAPYAPTVEAFRREIIEAQAANLDGFALNVGSWDPSFQTYYQTNVELMYQAAEQLGTGFKLFFSVNFGGETNVIDMIMAYANRPNTFRYNGKVVLSTYREEQLDWKLIRAALHTNGVNIFFIPYFFSAELPNTTAAQNLLATYTNLLDGVFTFAPAGALDQIVAANLQVNDATKSAGKISMCSVTPHYWGCVQYDVGRRYYESFGGEGLDLQWTQLIFDQPDWIEITTWNDPNESTYICPADHGALASSVPRRNPHGGYLELSKYYITWYKNGQSPPIDRDALFYFYRIHPKDLVITNDQPVQDWSGEIEDSLFLTTMLTQPANLVVTSGGVTNQFSQSSGLSSVRVPFNVGPQVIELWRDGARVGVINGPPIVTNLTNYNFFPTSGFSYFLQRSSPPPAAQSAKLKVAN